MFTDIHCHLNEIKDVPKIIQRAKEKDVKHFFSNSVDLQSMKKNLELQKKYPEIHACLGIHPSNLLQMTDNERKTAIDFLTQNIGQCSGIGETGLDYKHAQFKEDRELQIEFFRKHIRLAKKNNLPIIVHSRRAVKKCLDILIEEEAKNVLMHWFTGNSKELEIVKKHGFLVSFGPTILSDIHSQRLILELPIGLITLETDSPVKFDNEPSEPSWIPLIAEKIGILKKIEIKELSNVIMASMKEHNFFKKKA